MLHIVGVGVLVCTPWQYGASDNKAMLNHVITCRLHGHGNVLAKECGDVWPNCSNVLKCFSNIYKLSYAPQCWGGCFCLYTMAVWCQ